MAWGFWMISTTSHGRWTERVSGRESPAAAGVREDICRHRHSHSLQVHLRWNTQPRHWHMHYIYISPDLPFPQIRWCPTPSKTARLRLHGSNRRVHFAPLYCAASEYNEPSRLEADTLRVRFLRSSRACNVKGAINLQWHCQYCRSTFT